MTSYMDLAAAGLNLISAFLGVGTAVLTAYGLADRLRNGRSPANAEPVAREEASPFRRFAGWTPDPRRRSRQGRRSG